MRKFLIVAVIVYLSMCILVGCNKDKKDDGDNEIEVVIDEDVTQPEAVQNTEVPESIAPQGDGGGNEYMNEGEATEIKTISILVSENYYFYENAPIEFDEIVSMIEQTDVELVVEVTDNKATHKAYDKLLDMLEELAISVIEK